MSQFQQPQDNKYVRPEVLDLGTGRQFERLSVSKKGEGTLGSGASGGGWVQGQSRTGTGLSGVDPLAQILGTASSTIKHALQADQTMAKAVDARTNKELDKLEEDHQADLLSMSPEEAAAAHRKRLEEWRQKHGKLGKRGTARAKYKKMKREAVKADKDLDFENDYLGIQDLITTFGGDEGMTIDALEQWVARWEDTPYEEAAIRQTRDQLEKARGRQVSRDIEEDVRVAQHRFKGLLVDQGFGRWDKKSNRLEWDASAIHKFATENGIDLNDADAHIQMGEEFLGLMDPELQDLDFTSRENIIKSWSRMYDAEAKDFIHLAKAFQHSVDSAASVRKNANDWSTYFEKIRDPEDKYDEWWYSDQAGKAIPFDEELATRFSRTAADRYRDMGHEDTDWHTSEDKATTYADMLLADSLRFAQDAETPDRGINAFIAARYSLPATLEDARALGWLAADDSHITEDEWGKIRERLDERIRGKQVEYSKPFFSEATRLAEETGDMAAFEHIEKLLRQMDYSVYTDQTLEVGPFGLTELWGRKDVKPFSPAGLALSEIQNDFETKRNRAMETASRLSYSGESRVRDVINAGKAGLSAEMQMSGKSNAVPRSQFEDSPSFNLGPERFDAMIRSGASVEEAANKVKGEFVAAHKNADGSVPNFVAETLHVINQYTGGDVKAPPAIVRAGLALAPIHAFNRGAGSGGGDHRDIVGRYAQGMIADIFSRATHGKSPTGDDALTLATLYMGAGDKELRESLFPNADNRAVARRMALILKNKKAFVDGDRFEWAGATAEDFRMTDVTFQEASDGYRLMETTSTVGASGYENLESTMINALIDPLAMSTEILKGNVPSPVQEAMLLIAEDKKDWFEDLRDGLGLSEDTNLKVWLASGNISMTELEDTISIRVASYLGSGEAALQDAEKMAEDLGLIVTEAIDSRLYGKAAFDTFMVDDPTGGIRQLRERTGKGASATGADLVHSLLDYSVDSVVQKRGMTPLTPDERARHMGLRDMGDHYVDSSGTPVELEDLSSLAYERAFRDMFKEASYEGAPLFGDDFNFGAVWDRAIEATPNKDPRQVSMGDLLFYSWAEEGKGGENFTRTHYALKGTKLFNRGDRTIFRVPHLNVEFEFVSPMNLDGQLAGAIYSSAQRIVDEHDFKITPEVRLQERERQRDEYEHQRGTATSVFGNTRTIEGHTIHH